MADARGAENTENPLLTARPPQTDYLSYLTILEYNLTVDQLPLLHTILQDETLTANIGWDLVHLLLPLLPASQQCLQDVSRLGNPREVVLKVTELLEGIGRDDEVEFEEQNDDEAEETTAKKLEDLKREDIKVHVHGDDADDDEKHDEPTSTSPSIALRFIALVEMLSILHPRIKTKYPSRFLSTSLQATLPAYMQVANQPEATDAVLGFIKDLSGTQRPKLPPRKSSSAVITQPVPQSAPDPEGQDEVLSAEEKKLQIRLLHSFLTYVTEGYMTSLLADGDVPGMAWSCRYLEKLHPEKSVPGRRTFSSRFSDEDHLHQRDTILGHILALVRDLKLDPDELLSAITKPDDNPEVNDETEEELPSMASDVPLSRTGSLYLLATIAASTTFFSSRQPLPPLHLIPDFAAILNILPKNPTGNEPEPLVDAVLFLGTYIFHNQPSPSTDPDTYRAILYTTSLFSANLPSPVFRYNAHSLTTTLLHAHPSPPFRLAFITTTLEHSPSANLKASAVGWLKDEFLFANHAQKKNGEQTQNEEEQNVDSEAIFTTPTPLTPLTSPHLFPHLATLIPATGTLEQQYAIFHLQQSFFLAVLNLLYLLLSSPSLSHLITENLFPSISSFLSGLSECSRQLRTALLAGEIFEGEGEGEEEERGRALAGLELVDMRVEMVEGKMGNWGGDGRGGG
ncbi:YAP1-binding protein 1 [Lecanora helva]